MAVNWQLVSSIFLRMLCPLTGHRSYESSVHIGRLRRSLPPRQHHTSPPRPEARGAHTRREEGAATALSTQGDAAASNPSQRPCGKILRSAKRTGRQDYKAFRDVWKVLLVPDLHLSADAPQSHDRQGGPDPAVSVLCTFSELLICMSEEVHPKIYSISQQDITPPDMIASTQQPVQRNLLPPLLPPKRSPRV